MAVQVEDLGLDCHTCSDNDKLNFGCNNSPSDPARWQFEGVFLKRCPLKILTRQSLLLLKYYNSYKQGYLFNEGTIAHQPAKMMEAFQIIDTEWFKVREEKEKQQP